MRIELVIVSVGYGDFLAATLPENLPLVDDILVVTSPTDRETIDVCRRWSTRYVMSEEYKRGGEFNKARLIERGFSSIGADDWIVHADADIIFPRQFRRHLDQAHLDERAIYGADRRYLVGWDTWAQFKAQYGFWDTHRYEVFAEYPGNFDPGVRICSAVHGYVPIGFFQLFHGSQLFEHGMHVRRYPTRHGTAARSDVQFALQWDRRHRHLLPEVTVLHLESESGRMGLNWNGRKTKRFAPDRPAMTSDATTHRRRDDDHRHHHEPYC